MFYWERWVDKAKIYNAAQYVADTIRLLNTVKQNTEFR